MTGGWLFKPMIMKQACHFDPGTTDLIELGD